MNEQLNGAMWLHTLPTTHSLHFWHLWRGNAFLVLCIFGSACSALSSAMVLFPCVQEHWDVGAGMQKQLLRFVYKSTGMPAEGAFVHC